MITIALWFMINKIVCPQCATKEDNKSIIYRKVQSYNDINIDRARFQSSSYEERVEHNYMFRNINHMEKYPYRFCSAQEEETEIASGIPKPDQECGCADYKKGCQ